MRLLIIIILFTSTSALAQTITNNKILTCSAKSKCLVQPNSGKIKPILVNFNEKLLAKNKKRIISIQFIYPIGKTESSTIKAMEPVAGTEPYEFRYVDINGDKYLDLALRTSRGAHQNHYQYWVYSPKKSSYLSLGVYPELGFNPQLKKIQSLSRHGSISTQNYKLRDNKLIEVK